MKYNIDILVGVSVGVSHRHFSDLNWIGEKHGTADHPARRYPPSSCWAPKRNPRDAKWVGPAKRKGEEGKEGMERDAQRETRGPGECRMDRWWASNQKKIEAHRERLSHILFLDGEKSKQRIAECLCIL